jgi:5'-3' exonuclease
MDYLFIDGNNLAHKAVHAYNVSTSSGEDSSMAYGFFDQLIHIRRSFRNYVPLVVWDGGHDKRDELSEAGVKKGLVKSAYKANREDSGVSSQIELVQKFLSYTNIPQFRRSGVEADDMIASFCERYGRDSTVVCFTCDKDYYQLISNNVSVVSRRKGEEDIWNYERFKEEYDIEPYQWVDIGALSGDKGDNIVGVYGVGPKKAIAYIKEYGSFDKVVDGIRKKLEPLRIEYPDLQSQEDVDKLLKIEVGRNNEKPYDCCFVGMPFSGVALALEEGKIKKCNKADLKVAMYKERIELAYELKGMYRDLPVPEVSFKDSFDEKAFFGMCRQMEFVKIPMQVSYLRDFP